MSVILNDTYRSFIVICLFALLFIAPSFSIIGYVLHHSGVIVLSFIVTIVNSLVIVCIYAAINSKIVRAREAKARFFVLQQTHGEPKVVFKDEHTLGSTNTIYELAITKRNDFDPVSGLVNPDVERSGKFVQLSPGDFLPPQKSSNLLDLLGDLEETSDPNVFTIRNDASKLDYYQRRLYTQIHTMKKELNHATATKIKEQLKRHGLEIEQLETAGQFIDPWKVILNATNDLTGAYSGMSEDTKMATIKSKSGKISKKEMLEKISKNANAELKQMAKKEGGGE